MGLKNNLRKLTKSVLKYSIASSLLFSDFLYGQQITNKSELMAILPSLGGATISCVLDKDNHKVENGVYKCESRIWGYANNVGTVETKGLLEVHKDGKEDGYQEYLIVFYPHEGKKIGGVVGIKKTLHLCDKDGIWIEQESYKYYDLYVCENGEVKTTYRIRYDGWQRTSTPYNSPVFIFRTPSNLPAGSSTPQILYEAATVNVICGGKLFKEYNKPLPLSEIEKRAKKECGESLYNFACVENPSAGISVCYKIGDPYLPAVAGKIAGY